MPETVYGGKYEENLDTAEIAKRIRLDIKAGIKAGELPEGLKTSVRTRRFAGGSAIDIEITAAPGIRILNPERLRRDFETPHTYYPGGSLPWQAEEAQALVKKLEAIHKAYNFDGSDSMTDYFHVNYYGSVTWDWRLERAERDAFNALQDAKARALEADAKIPVELAELGIALQQPK